MAKKIFISYRREDTAPAAGRVYDRLCQILPKANVFFDVSTIKGGEDFESRIVTTINASDAALAFIGPRWLDRPAGADSARLWEPNDYVRAEVRAALERSILVLPVLVEGATMPHPEQLPKDIEALAARNALPLRHVSFDDDTENILAAILGGAAKGRSWDNKGGLAAKFAYAIAGAVAALLLLGLLAVLHFALLGRPLSVSLGDPAATTLLLVAAPILGAWLGLAYEARKRRRRM